MTKHNVILFSVGPIHVVRWKKSDLREFVTNKIYDPWPFEFWGIGIGGFYIGFHLGRLGWDASKQEENNHPMAKWGHAPADPPAGNEVNPPQSRRYEGDD